MMIADGWKEEVVELCKKLFQGGAIPEKKMVWQRN